MATWLKLVVLGSGIQQQQEDAENNGGGGGGGFYGRMPSRGRPVMSFVDTIV
jgi:hypothetical protein